MVKKKTPRKTARRAAPARRIYRRRAKSGYDKIAPAIATVALAAVNYGPVKQAVKEATQDGLKPAKILNRVMNDRNGATKAVKKLVSSKQLVNDAAAIAGGYIGGEIVRKYAPTVIKKPIAKLAKKIPKVI